MEEITMAAKSVIITGGASGIGLAMTRHFASMGHYVAVLDVNSTEGNRVVAAIASEYPSAKVSFQKCNVTLWQEQAAAFKQAYIDHGKRLDIVMANAGISDRSASRLIAPEEEEPSEPGLGPVDVNLKGVIYCE